MSQFRFEKLEIWKRAFKIANELYDMSDVLEENKLFRFAEQLRGAGLSITNNIAEGAGSTSNREFKQFINYSRRSVFECANIIISIEHRGHITIENKSIILNELDILSRQLTSFSRSLN